MADATADSEPELVALSNLLEVAGWPVEAAGAVGGGLAGPPPPRPERCTRVQAVSWEGAVAGERTAEAKDVAWEALEGGTVATAGTEGDVVV